MSSDLVIGAVSSLGAALLVYGKLRGPSDKVLSSVIARAEAEHSAHESERGFKYAPHRREKAIFQRCERILTSEGFRRPKQKRVVRLMKGG